MHPYQEGPVVSQQSMCYPRILCATFLGLNKESFEKLEVGFFQFVEKKGMPQSSHHEIRMRLSLPQKLKQPSESRLSLVCTNIATGQGRPQALNNIRVTCVAEAAVNAFKICNQSGGITSGGHQQLDTL